MKGVGSVEGGRGRGETGGKGGSEGEGVAHAPTARAGIFGPGGRGGAVPVMAIVPDVLNPTETAYGCEQACASGPPQHVSLGHAEVSGAAEVAMLA